MFKRIGIFLLAGVIGAFCLELGEQIWIPRRTWPCLPCRGYSWGSADARERRRRRAADGAAQLTPVINRVAFTLGAEPIFLLPTGTDELLGAGKWGAGPTGARDDLPVSNAMIDGPRIGTPRRGTGTCWRWTS